jgi:hypothetical protein
MPADYDSAVGSDRAAGRSRSTPPAELPEYRRHNPHYWRWERCSVGVGRQAYLRQGFCWISCTMVETAVGPLWANPGTSACRIPCRASSAAPKPKAAQPEAAFAGAATAKLDKSAITIATLRMSTPHVAVMGPLFEPLVAASIHVLSRGKPALDDGLADR